MLTGELRYHVRGHRGLVSDRLLEMEYDGFGMVQEVIGRDQQRMMFASKLLGDLSGVWNCPSEDF